MAIFAPSLAALRAIANPIPRDAPVINNVFPFKFPLLRKSGVSMFLITETF